LRYGSSILAIDTTPRNTVARNIIAIDASTRTDPFSSNTEMSFRHAALNKRELLSEWERVILSIKTINELNVYFESKIYFSRVLIRQKTEKTLVKR